MTIAKLGTVLPLVVPGSEAESATIEGPRVSAAGLEAAAAVAPAPVVVPTPTVAPTLRTSAAAVRSPYEDPNVLKLFPSALADIPEQLRVRAVDNPPVYVLDGKVCRAAQSKPVYSKIALRSSAGLDPILVGHEPQLGEADAKAAINAANKAWDGGFGAWPTSTLDVRIAACEKFIAALESSTDRVATLLMYEIGKSRAVATTEVTRTVQYLKDTLVEARKLAAEDATAVTVQNGAVAQNAKIHRVPLGKVLCVAPFNYPINEFLTTLVPALLMGNVVIAKTARHGALATQALSSAFAECFPPGTVSVLPGDGRAVLPHVIASADSEGQGDIDMFTFIGSEKAANSIIAQHPTPSTLNKILGLGAKNPAVILEGADLEAVASKLVKGSLGFNGQRCTAEKIIFVPRAHAEEFATILSAKIDKLKLGMPWDEDVGITPLPEDNKIHTMRAYIQEAVAKGARVVNTKGGEGSASLMRPAVVLGVDPSMKLYREEQFGPIVPIAIYDDVREVVEWQKTSPFRQQAGIWGPADAVAKVAPDFGRFVSRVNLNDVCQRGPDAFPFSASGRSGSGTLSLRAALTGLSRDVLIQSPDAALLSRTNPESF
jgi:glyceraldehyde-3-phosphate dehydrogenase (NADP+)